jgi:hypothetical protein
MYRQGGGKGAGCQWHPGCRVGIPGLTAWAGGWVRRDLRGMLLCLCVCLSMGGPLRVLGGGGGGGGSAP